MAFDFKNFQQTIPHKPGVYQFYDKDGELIYVGKAKDLRSRVSSYFNNDPFRNAKTKTLVSKIANLHFTIVDTEIDAWLLENSLIKKYQPRYNVLLKDDKTYPSICIKKEPFPRVFATRTIIRDGSTYFGPYASVKMMKTILDLAKSLFPFRTCSLNLTKENIDARKFKVCLEYQLGNCKGPCEALQTEDDYIKNIRDLKEILKGHIAPVLSHLREEMQESVRLLQFEQAQRFKEKIEILENYQSKSTVVNPGLSNIDVFSIASDEKYAFVNYLKVSNGTIAQTQTIELKKKLDETEDELLKLALIEFRARFESNAKEIIVPFELEIEDENLLFTVPRQGDKKKLLELSLKNALYFKKEKLDQYDKLNPEHRKDRILLQMQKDLRLSELPRHIECFDNSNFQGKYPVSAMVVFKDAKASKKDYRHYNVKTVEGPDDFATMREVVHRRYSRVLEEKSSLPQLIIIDGGKGQLSAALDSLRALGIEKKVAIIGIAKKLEELYYPGDSLPLYLDKKSETLRIIQQLRDEAHRFGITFHRKKREKGTIKSELEEIKGIGKSSMEKLLLHFKSLKKIKEAGMNELLQVLDKKKAELVSAYFTKEKGA